MCMKSKTVGNNKTNNAWLEGDLEEWQTQEVIGFAIPQGHPLAQALFV